MRNLSIILLLLQTFFSVTAQDFTREIPEELTKNANAVVRNYTKTFHVLNEGKARVSTHVTITILNEKADGIADLQVAFNDFTKVRKINGAIFDKTGKRVKKIKRKDIEKYSLSGYQEVGDSYVKYVDFLHTDYPYTIDYTYEVERTNMLFYPVWTPVFSSEDVSVEYSSFKIIAPKALKVRYKESNLSNKGTITTADGQTTYLWEAKNLKPYKIEPNSPPLRELLPFVFTAPSAFTFDIVSMEFTNWDDMGTFYHTLNKSQGELPSDHKAKLASLVAGANSIEEKARKIYEHLQNNTRYVSVQLGIGGWQSMLATEVTDKGYGDCKALTNYAQAMLKAVDITSYPVLIRADKPDIDVDFPSSQFNHVILCIPQTTDSLWLECTSQTTPFNYLGSFTGNRHGVLVTPDGGKLIRTKAYRAEDNSLNRTINIEYENGKPRASIKTIYTGIQQESRARVINSLTNEKQRDWIVKNLDIPGGDLINFKLAQDETNHIPEITESLDIQLKNLYTINGSRLFIVPNILNKSSYIPYQSQARKSNVKTNYPYLDEDKVVIEIPEDYDVEYLPEDQVLDTPFGKYKATYKMQKDRLVYERSMQRHEVNLPPDQFKEYKKFRKKIVKYDKTKVVFVKR